jgi:serine/threonine-protein kinase
MDDVSLDPRVGSVLQERYRILERLAVGSMGIVYRAERVQLGRPLAVKFLHASYASDPTFIQRFERETRVMGRLAHPHCVSVIDFGVDSGPYVVMEFVSGRTLRSLIEGGRLSVERAVHITRQTLAGLAHAHSLGIIHRDIKPANIMLMEATGTGDHVRILDFGLATLREQASSEISHSAIVIGTPNYMSPEQSIGGKADVRSDVYSTGVVLFELLTGRKPFTSDDTFELLSMHRTAPVPRLANVVPDADFPSGMQAVVDRALAKAPEDRFQTAMAFATALDDALDRPVYERVRHATRPVPSGPGEQELPDYRSALGVARSDARRAARPRRRRRRSSIIAALLLLAVGGAAWGGYRIWRGEFGKRVRALVNQGSPSIESKAQGSDEAPAPAPTGEASKSVAPEPPPEPEEPPPRTESGSPGAAAEPKELKEDREAVPIPDEPPPIPVSDAGPAGASAGEADPGEDEIPADPPLPAEERVEPVAPVGEDTPVVDNAEADSAAAAQEKRPDVAAAVAASGVDTVPEAVALIRSGKRDEAIQALLAMRKKSPKSAYVPYLLGHLYFEKGWWTVGMDQYDAAIANNELYRAKQVLNQNLIRALGKRGTRKKAARMFVNTIGRPALPFLRKAAKSDPNTEVRGWSGWLVWRLTQLSRQRPRHR